MDLEQGRNSEEEEEEEAWEYKTGGNLARKKYI